jgi:hypothetical protein
MIQFEEASELRQLLTTPPDRGALREEVMARVVTRYWATGPYFEVLPLDAERGGWVRGSIIEREPAIKDDEYLFGFDDEKRLLIMRSYMGSEARFFEAFFRHESSRTVIWQFGDRVDVRDLREVKVLSHRSDGQPLRTIGISHYGELEEIYEHDERGNLVKIQVAEHITGSNVTNVTYSVEYDESGVSSVVATSDVGEMVVYNRKLRPLAKVLSDLKTVLRDAIGLSLLRLPASSKPCVVLLPYGSESASELLPTQIAISGRAVVDDWLRRPDAKEEELLMPDYVLENGGCAVDLSDPVLDALAAEIGLIVRQPQQAARVIRVLIEVCKSLAAQVGSTDRETSLNVVIIPADYEGADVVRNARSILGKEGLRAMLAALTQR